ncbi:MAG TPA: radical SAM protein [Clostridiales bacterium]|nr:radical SAM protein [Clostridiales bacterium]
MKHSNIAIFVPHVGCPNMCSFCNQRSISGQESLPTAENVAQICEQAMREVSDKSTAEIAFFGGSFTAIERGYMVELLKSAYEFVGENGFKGIRISTRPDCIDNEVLALLKKYGVTAIELGAQSMVDEVLFANNRGHCAEDVVNASRLIKENGFELGLQMMVGLYKSTAEFEYETMREIAKLSPETVRVYPVVVLNGTRLGELYKAGDYRLYSFDEVVEICAEMLCFFERNGIKIIRMGLHASETVESEMVAGFYHPAFKEIVESRIYRNNITKIINNCDTQNCYNINVNSSCISKALGHKKSNAMYFEEKGICVKIKPNSKLEKYECELEDGYQCI